MVTRSVTNRYENLGGGGSGLARYVTQIMKILPLSRQNFNTFFVYSFKIASKYLIVIAVVSSCTYFAIEITYTYVCLLLKVIKTTFKFKILNIFLLKLLRNGEVGDWQN